MRPNTKNTLAFAVLIGLALLSGGTEARADKEADATVLVNDGTELMRANRNVESLAKFQDALKLCPTSVVAHHNMGLVLQKLGRLDEAEKEYKSALELAPARGTTVLSLGGLYQQQKRPADAIAAYQQFLKLDPKNKDAAKVTNLINGLARQPAPQPEASERSDSNEDAFAVK